MTDTGQGIFLVGEAAKSWVQLEWFKTYIALGLTTIFVIIMVAWFLYSFAEFQGKEERKKMDENK